MDAIITSFRRSRHTQTDNHMILVVDGVDSKDKANGLVGKKVVFKTESGKELTGKVAAAHGNKGAIRAIFDTGMPGQSLGKKVSLE